MGGNGTPERDENTDHSDERRGWPDELFLAMKAGHDRFMQQTKAVNERVTHEDGNLNPFAIFKSFVDTQLGTLVDSFRSLPANLAELRAQMEDERDRRRRHEARSHKRWTNVLDESPDHFAMRVDRVDPGECDDAFVKVLTDMRTSHQLNAHVSPSKIRALFLDEGAPIERLDLHATPMLSPGGACEYMRESGNAEYNQVATSNATIWRWPAESPRWLSVDWFKKSPYSPVNIETSDDVSDHAACQWRAAFEDLLNAALDKPMATEQRHHGESTLPGVSWMISLQRRGILPPQVPRTHNATGQGEDVTVGLDRMLQDDTTRSLPRRIAFPLNRDLASLTEAYLTQALLSRPMTSQSRLLTTDSAESPASTSMASQYERLLERGQRVLGDEVTARELSTGRLPLDQLDAVVSRLEQEFEALQLDESRHHEANTPLNEQGNKSQQPPDKVDVLSSLTTTHTTRLPDGTVTTKIILKQRFADGREETQEKVHTYTESSRDELQGRESENEDESHNDARREKTGWFWK